MSENKTLYPNTFQTHNFYVDEILKYLSGEEWKCLSVVIRKIIGFQKTEDHISTSQISEFTGLNIKTVSKCMNNLLKFGLVIRTEKNSPLGAKWKLQLDVSQVRMDEIQSRAKLKKENNLRRTHKMKQAKELQSSHDLTSELQSSDDLSTPVVPLPTQNPQLNPQLNNDTFGIVEGAEALSETETVSETAPEGNTTPLPEQRAQSLSEPARRTAAKVRGDAIDGMQYFGRLAEQRNPVTDKILQYPADVQRMLTEIVTVFSFPDIPKPSKAKGGQYAQWIRELRYLVELCKGHGVEPIRWAYKANLQRPREISHPAALNSLVFNALREHKAMQEKQQAATRTTGAPQPAYIPAPDYIQPLS